MIILGIDPGLASTGIGVIEESPKGDLRELHRGFVITKAGAPMPERLRVIHAMVESAIEKYRPNVISMESIFFAKNVRSAVLMAHGRGAAMLAAARSGTPVMEYSPLEIKQSVVGKGRAGKDQVRQMVTMLLNIKDIIGSDHEADALAAAITHAFRRKGVGAVRKAAAEATTADAAFDERKELLGLAMQRRRGRRR